MIDLNDGLVQLKITSAVCSSVAIVATIFRLLVRRHRFWWDDAWAGFSMLAMLVQVAAVFLHVPDPSELSRTNRIAAYYLMATTFYSIIWSARLSILFSVIRIDPSKRRGKCLLIAAVFFLVTWLVLMAQLFWVCEPEMGWKDTKSPQCVLNKEVAICQLVSDILSDALLLFAPLRLLQGLEDKRLRRRLFLIFSTCIVTTIVSLVHAAYILHRGGIKVVLAALVEDCVSLIVCNLPIIVARTFTLSDANRKKHTQRRLTGTFMSFATRSKTNAATVDLGTVGATTMEDRTVYGDCQSDDKVVGLTPDDGSEMRREMAESSLRANMD